MTANYFNGLLTNNICFEERDKDFNYSNIIYDHKSDFTPQLYNQLYSISNHELTSKNSMFDFIELEKDEEIDMLNYMKYDDWQVQFLDLCKKIKEQLEKHKKCV